MCIMKLVHCNNVICERNRPCASSLGLFLTPLTLEAAALEGAGLVLAGDLGISFVRETLLE